MTRTFMVLENINTGMLGFIEKGAPQEFEPLAPMGTAHDCLEHFPGDDGSIDHEFMALGCMAWIRGEGGYWNEPFEQNLTDEMTIQLWPLYLNGECVLRVPNRINIEIEECIKIACSRARKTLAEEGMNNKLNTFIRCAEYWLQVGYNRAIRRYPNRYQACDVFREIEYQLGKILPDAYEYQEVTVQYVMTTRKVNVKLKEDRYDY